MNAAFKKVTAIVVAVFRDGLGVELHPKVAASGVGAAGAGLVLAGLAVAGVHTGAAEQEILASVVTVLAGFAHPPYILPAPVTE